MARTIHDTLGVADRAMRADWSDDEIPEAIASEMRRNWMRQQAIRDSEPRSVSSAGSATARIPVRCSTVLDAGSVASSRVR
jgi:hypothetical protein